MEISETLVTAIGLNMTHNASFYAESVRRCRVEQSGVGWN